MALCVMPTMFAQLSRVQVRDRYPSYQLVDLVPGLLLISALWPLLVWRGETWGKRDYHASLPASKPAHDLWRVLSGAAWLMLGVAASALLGIFIIYHVQGGAPVHLPNGDHVHFYPAASFWASFFAGPLIVYTFVSILPLAVRNPLQWLVSIVLAIASFSGLGSLANWSLAHAWFAFLNHPFGINVVLTSQTLSKWYQFLADAGAPILIVVSDFGWTTNALDSRPATVVNWFIAVAIWLSIGVLGVLLAARRRQ